MGRLWGHDASGQGGKTSVVFTTDLVGAGGNGATATVFVIQGGKIEAHQVKVGLRTSQAVTILSGVAAGDRLAIGDLAQLHDGVKVTVQE